MALLNRALSRSSGAVALAIGLVWAGPHYVSGADRKWPTDDTLRSGMAAIRKATLDNHTLVTHRRMPLETARRFAALVASEINRIKAGTELPPAATPDIDSLLADIALGAEAVAGRGGRLTPIDGIVQIDAALGRYPERFDDPTWQPLR